MARFTTFFGIPRELRQKILLGTYDVLSGTSPHNKDPDFPADLNPRMWTFREHKEGIDAWTAVLYEVDDKTDFTQDVDYVKQTLHDELLAMRKQAEKVIKEKWEECTVNPSVIWKITREGEPPWCQLANCLFSVRSFCRWELEVQDLDEVLQFQEDMLWDHGTSGVRWDVDGGHHRHTNWDTLGAAAEQDIAWLSKWIREYHNSLPRRYRRRVPLPIEFEAPIPEHWRY